jgi:hypothetical protein
MSRLLLERADVGDQSVELVRPQLALVGLHLLLDAIFLHLQAVVDGDLDLVVGQLLLPIRGRHVPDGHLFALVGLRLAVCAVAGGALGAPEPIDLWAGRPLGQADGRRERDDEHPPAHGHPP